MKFYTLLCLLLLLFCTKLSAQNGSLNNKFNELKYGDSVQVITVDSFWMKGMFVNQNDSELVLYKIYDGNFSVAKKSVAAIKINSTKITYINEVNKQEPKQVKRYSVKHGDSAIVETGSYSPPPTDDRFSYDNNTPQATPAKEKFNDDLQSNRAINDELYTGNYFISSCAIGLKKGEGNLKAYYSIFPTVSYALTDNFTIGGGVEFVSLMLQSPVFMLKGKVTTEIAHNLHIGASYIFGGVANFNPKNSFTSLYTNFLTGIVTYGNKEANISLNVTSEVNYSGAPNYAISAYYQVSENFAFITENIALPTFFSNEYVTIYSLGGRATTLGEHVWEGGIFANKEILQAGFVLPYISYMYLF